MLWFADEGEANGPRFSRATRAVPYVLAGPFSVALVRRPEPQKRSRPPWGRAARAVPGVRRAAIGSRAARAVADAGPAPPRGSVRGLSGRTVKSGGTPAFAVPVRHAVRAAGTAPRPTPHHPR
ncbi:hypothetical protein GCM10010106_07550 [Thermopolyspora flexuosa]|nr:hypothetical protein GCM10010106_07550 [Thermopolyspora flexuosa]